MYLSVPKLRSQIVRQQRSVQNYILGGSFSNFEPLQSSKLSVSPQRRAHVHLFAFSALFVLPGPTRAQIETNMHTQIDPNATNT